MKTKILISLLLASNMGLPVPRSVQAQTFPSNSTSENVYINPDLLTKHAAEVRRNVFAPNSVPNRFIYTNPSLGDTIRHNFEDRYILDLNKSAGVVPPSQPPFFWQKEEYNND